MKSHPDIVKIIALLKGKYARARIALNYETHMQLLAAVIMSAQCTDERVNKVTEKLFKKYRTPQDFAKADLLIFENEIRSTGFFRAKAKNIINSAKAIVSYFEGKVPDTMAGILTLPGVARKTANIVLGNAYGIVEGIAVDTHVIRISNLLRLTKNDNPVKIEQDLMRIVPREDWFRFSYLIQSLGRDVCVARRPKCPECVLKDICPSSKA